MSKRPENRYFLIHCMPRSASTSIRQWMNSAEGCVCHGEIMGQNNVRGTSHKQHIKFTKRRRNREPDIFFHRYFEKHRGKAVGFKGLSSHLLDYDNLTFMRKFFSHNPLIINLYRRDLVSRFSSSIFHRLKAGHIESKHVLRIRVQDVLSDCMKSVEEWNIATSYWVKDREYVNIDIKNFSDQERFSIERALKINLEHEIGKKNSDSGEFARQEVEDAVAHLTEVCSDPILDPYRDIFLGEGNQIWLDEPGRADKITAFEEAQKPRDDLTEITGISLAAQQKLYDNQVYFYRQMAIWTKAQRRIMSNRIGVELLRDWQLEAARLVQKNTGEVIEVPEDTPPYDDFSKIKGIDETLGSKLYEHDVRYYRQMAVWSHVQRRIMSNRIGAELLRDWQLEAARLVQESTGEAIDVPADIPPFDDLTKITGINQVLAETLNTESIKFYKQIANWNENQRHVIGAKIDHDIPVQWVEEAKVLLDQKIAGLKRVGASRKSINRSEEE